MVSCGSTVEFVQRCLRNSKSRVIRNLLAIRRTAIRGTELTLNARLGTENLLIEQLLFSIFAHLGKFPSKFTRLDETFLEL